MCTLPICVQWVKTEPQGVLGIRALMRVVPERWPLIAPCPRENIPYRMQSTDTACYILRMTRQKNLLVVVTKRPCIMKGYLLRSEGLYVNPPLLTRTPRAQHGGTEHTSCIHGRVIAHPHLLVRVTNKRFLPTGTAFKIGLASENHLWQPVLVLAVHWWPTPTPVSVGGL